MARTSDLDRVGDIMVPDGADLVGYRRNPIVLADHDPTKPIGRVDAPRRLEALLISP